MAELELGTLYPTIADAETAIVGAGYKRDAQRALWVRALDGRTAKVISANPNKFGVVVK